MIAQEFSGDLVTLREPQESDDRVFRAWLANPAVKETMAGTDSLRVRMPRPRQELVITRRSDGLPLGSAIFRTLAPAARAGLEVVIGEESGWEQGYGRDTLATLARFGFEELGFRHIQLEVRALDERARYTYERAGFTYESLRPAAEDEAEDVLVMGLVRQ